MFANELIVRNILIESADQIVPVQPRSFDFVIPVIAEGLGEAHHIHPLAGPMLSEMRRGEQAVNETLICAKRFVANEQIDFKRAIG